MKIQMVLSQSVDLAGAVPEWIRVLPLGHLVSDHGPFLVDQEAMTAIINHFKGKGNDNVIDYEHQTLQDIQAPAGGWVKEYQIREDGLWGRVEWTARASEYISNKEYRYISPVIMVRKSDQRAVEIHSIGLTNAPAIHGMPPIVNKAGKENDKAMEFLKMICKALGLPETTPEEDVLNAVQALQTAGNLVANKEILAALGVPEDATKEKALAAVTALKDGGTLVANKEILNLLEVPETADVNTVKGKIIALKNPSGYVRVEDFNALKNKLDLRDRDELVNMALKGGKITPAQKDWAEQYALKDPTGFKAFVDQAPEVVPLSERLTDSNPPPRNGGLDEAQMMINKQLGLSDESYKKFGGEQ